ncbi:aldo/keto reductase [Geothrix sp. 21YS21S-2]|uniref:aldo/keto reductase n=1 Tax=Geothrix sp. 21YS21S-2 TaxID=3068893 RepID=UPI0027BA8CE3|nr:aldo/keto reductase [Geothrix sp. 21YS21S-2]
MKYRTFPRIPGAEVSVLGFGCMRLPVVGGDMKHIDEEAARALVRRAIDGGVNYVDTAYGYHGGQSEPFVGRALRDGYRERVHLATKLPIWLVGGEGDVERLLDEQLRKLDTGTIDFYLVHALNAERWETVVRHHVLRALERAQKDGRIRHLGFSMHDSLDVFKTIIDGHAWDFCQIQYNFLDEGYQAGTRGLRYAAERGIGTIAMEPLRGGTLAVAQPADVLAVWARSPEPRTPAEWALRWVWNHPEVVTLLSGMNTMEQVEENLAVSDSAAAGAMGPGELELVEAVRRIYAARVKVPCTTCGYCAPCPSGVAIPDVFSSWNTGGMFGNWATAKGVYDMFIAGAGHGGDRCEACGACEPKCPQQIPIKEKLREAHAALS